MTSTARLGVLVGLLAAPLASAEGFDGPLAEVALVGGAQGLTPAGDDLFGGVKVAGGWKTRLPFSVLRAEATGAALFSRGFWRPAYDLGVSVSMELLALLIDPSLSAGLFVRLDAAARFAAPTGPVQVGFVPAIAVGVHAGGLWVAVAGGAELFLHLPSSADPRFTGYAQVGVELVELVHLANRLSEGKRPFPD